jgi:hypothetical protein
MNEMTLKGLRRAINSDWARSSKYAAIAVTIPGEKGTETIINSHKNIKNKMAYWETAYNEDLTSKTNPEVKIVGYSFANTFAAIEQELVWLA